MTSNILKTTHTDLSTLFDGREVVDQFKDDQNPPEPEVQTESVTGTPESEVNEVPQKPSILSLKKAINRTKANVALARDAKLALSTMKLFEPLISALTYYPGVNASDAQCASAIREMLQESEKVSIEICNALNIDRTFPDNGWIVGQSLQIAAHQVGNQWRRLKQAEEDHLNSDMFISAYREIAGSGIEIEESTVMPAMSAEIKIKLSMMKALTPIVSEVEILNSIIQASGREVNWSRDLILSQASDDIFESASDFAEVLSGDSTQPERLVVFQSALNQTGQIFAAALGREVDRVSFALDSGNLEAIAANTAVDMSTVRAAFKTNVARQRDTVNAIANKYITQNELDTNKPENG